MIKKLFGTDGMRGMPGAFPLDEDTLAKLGRALGEYLHPQAPELQVLLGMDTRESGPWIAAKFVQGLAAIGGRAISAGVIPTPGVAWLVRQRRFAAGVVISASHNPYQDNGVKLFSSQGMKFPDAVEAEIEARMESQAAVLPPLASAEVPEQAGLAAEYLQALRAAKLPGANLGGLRMVLDCANGAASRLAPDLFRSLGAEVIAIHDQPNGRNINEDCGSLHPEDMRARVLESGAALGVAFDGDADRAVFCTSTGRRVDGDGVLLTIARHMRMSGTLKRTTIVGTTMANLGLERALARDGLHLMRTQVGDRYVLEEMQRIGANLGGEQSGHIIFFDDATTGDGMLTAVKMASLVALAGPLDNLVADLKIFPQTIVNVRVRTQPPLDSLPAVAEKLRRAESALGDNGRIVLRYSGTEGLARVMVEAEREEDMRHWAGAIASAIKSAIGA
jgi:phosphoglucosamine mutase